MIALALGLLLATPPIVQQGFSRPPPVPLPSVPLCSTAGEITSPTSATCSALAGATAWAVTVKVRYNNGTNNWWERDNTTRGLWYLGTPSTGANTCGALIQSSLVGCYCYDSSAVSYAALSGGQAIATNEPTITCSYSNGTLTTWVNGVSVVSVTSVPPIKIPTSITWGGWPAVFTFSPLLIQNAHVDGPIPRATASTDATKTVLVGAELTSLTSMEPVLGGVNPWNPTKSLVALGDSFTAAPQIDLRPFGDPAEVNNGTTRRGVVGGRLSGWLGTNWIVYNYGVSGSTCSGAGTAYTSAKSDHGTPTWTHLLCGVNDIIGGSDGPTAWAAIKAVIDAVQADGSTVIASTIFPAGGRAGWTAGNETARLSANNSLKSYGTTATPNFTVLDSDALFGDGASPPTLVTCGYQGDHFHPNATCSNTWAKQIRLGMGSLAQ